MQNTHPKRFRSTVLTVACVALLIGGAELAARQYTRTHPTYDGWDNRTLYHRVQNAQQAIAKDKHWDLLLFGSSVGLPLQPARWREATGDKLNIYNACIGGQRPDMLRLLYESVFYPMGKPDKMVFIITPTDINAGTDPRAGQSPFWQAPRLRLINTELNPFKRLLAWVDLHSALFGMRRHLRSRIYNGTLPEEPDIYFSPDGSRLSPYSVTTPEIARKHNPLENFSFNPKQADAIVRLAGFCKEHGTELHLVSQPLPECAYEQCLTTTESQQVRTTYEAGLCDIEQRTGLTILRLNDGQTTFADELAYDALHANRFGAPRLMNDYWKQVIMPLYPALARTKNLPEEHAYRFADLATSETATERQESGLPWATHGVVCADDVTTALISLPGEFAPGVWLAEFSVQYPSQGEVLHAALGDGETTSPVKRMSDPYARETGLAEARLVVKTTAPLAVELGSGTRLNAIFVRQEGYTQ